MHNMIDVSIVILSHNRFADLQQNITRLLAERRSPEEFQIIVVDNNSTDGTREFLVELGNQEPSFQLVLNNNNLGVAAGRNSGFDKALRQFIVATDDDSMIDIADLRLVPTLFDSLPNVGLLAFRVVHATTGAQQNPHGDRPCLVANHHGAGFAFRRTLYTQFGGIDEECNYGAEELDFAIRVNASGLQVRYTPEITVFHNSFPRDMAEEQRRLQRRTYNNIRVYYKYFPAWMAARNSRRYLMSSLWAWARLFGLSSLDCPLRAAIDGRRVGLRLHRSLPPATVRFYNNRRLKPEFGNVPLPLKLSQKMRRSLSAWFLQDLRPTDEG